MPPDETERDRLSTAAFVVGLVSAVTAVVYFVAIPLGLVGLVLGILAMRRGTERRLSVAGTVLSIVGLAVALGVVAVLVADEHEPPETSVVNGIESGTADDEHPPQHDSDPNVRCQSEIDALRAGGRVTNHSNDVADYQLVVVWESNGRRLAEATAIIDAVDPGTTRDWEVTAVGQGDTATTCRVFRIDRTTT